MYDLLIKGGVLMIPIAICSVISLTVFLERLFNLTQGRISPSAFVKRVLPLFSEGKFSEAHLICQENNSPLARIIDTIACNGSEARVLDLSHVHESIEEQGRQENARMTRDLEIIGTIAAISPLLGLLGTVLGMITVFKRVETFGVGDPTILANGIWEALITTAAGLSVAIPTFLFHKILQGRVNSLTLSLEANTRTVLNHLPPNVSPLDKPATPATSEEGAK